MKLFLRNWVILLLPLMLAKMWWDRRILKKKYVIALTFHDVSSAETYKFERTLKFLKKRFAFLSPQEFEKYMLGQHQLQDVSLLVTFDDGFGSSRKVTEDILEPLCIKGVFFCCSDFIGLSENDARLFVARNLYRGQRTESEVTEAELAMSVGELQKLSQNGHLIAAHTQSHIDLGQEWPIETLNREIVNSSRAIEKLVSRPIEWFAFPFGGVQFINSAALDVIQKNFKFCFSGIRGVIDHSAHRMALPRQSITIQDPYLLQLALFFGATNWLHRWKTRRIENMARGEKC